MGDYVLRVRYDDEIAAEIPLRDCDPGDAETERQALAKEIEHAVELDAPLVYTSARAADPDKKVSIDPARATSVDLVDPLLE
jgi:hypothetical protein